MPCLRGAKEVLRWPIAVQLVSLWDHSVSLPLDKLANKGLDSESLSHVAVGKVPPIDTSQKL
eukprot:3963187-Amphidinium_carterae.3